MSKYYVKYSKKEKAKYISHLDFLRTLGRAMRRAHLPLQYSQGFNPHPLITFAAPLSVGILSDCEMFCTQLTDDISEKEFKDALNAAMPSCIRIISVTKETVDFSKIFAADYKIITENPVLERDLEAFMLQETILVDKKTKRGIKETDIKADIFNISVKDNIITATLKTSDSGSLKPMLLITALNKFEGIDTGFCRYKRLCFRDADNNLF